MIQYNKFILENGLRVIVHEDNSTPMAAVNVLYDVGARDESPNKTGFAHLFEHLMFGGSANIKNFDDHIQLAGGDSNAFTNSDLTNFYDIVPAENLETVFWLESDRMLQLDFSEQALDIQRKVVVEEFKETCLNQPYGDVWHHIADMAFEVHPYRWPTIGKIPKHVEDANLEDVKSFFYKYYRPNNAILVVAGNVTTKQVKELAVKWFGDIPKGEKVDRNLPMEPKQKVKHNKIVKANVPGDALFMAFHSVSRGNDDYYAIDLLTDVLSNGNSSRFYQKMVKEERLFSTIDAYITGNIDPGLLIIEGKPSEGVSVEEGKAAIWKELEILKTELVPDHELQKTKNKVESSMIFSEASVLNKAINLAFFELLGQVDLINKEVDLYKKVTPEDLIRLANEVFCEENCSEFSYLKNTPVD